MARGVEFASETDTEVVAHLAAQHLGEQLSEAAVRSAVATTFAELRGLNAIIVLDQATHTLTAVKNVSPLVLGRGSNGVYIASDALALVNHATEVCFLDDGQLAQLTEHGVAIYDAQDPQRELSPDWEAISVDEGGLGLSGYPHFMLKEMYQQPDVIEHIASEQLEPIRELAALIRESYGAFFVGCGTASYAALTGNYIFSRIARRHVNFVVGSEFMYQEHFLTDRSLVIALSQSGETADVIEPVLAAKQRGARIAALVNVKGSTLDRIADFSLHLNAGPEQCVLSTKAYTAKVAMLLLTAHVLNGTEHVGRDLLWRAVDGVRGALNPSVDGHGA